MPATHFCTLRAIVEQDAALLIHAQQHHRSFLDFDVILL